MKTSVLSVLLMAVGAFAADTVPQIGQSAPDFSLPSQDGSKISLHEFKGKWVVLYFYPKDGTAGCTIEVHNFQRDLAKYEQNHAIEAVVDVELIFARDLDLGMQQVLPPNSLVVVAASSSAWRHHSLNTGSVIWPAFRA